MLNRYCAIVNPKINWLMIRVENCLAIYLKHILTKNCKNCLKILRKNCSNSEFFWSSFFVFGLNIDNDHVNLRIQSEYEKMPTRENSESEHFLQSEPRFYFENECVISVWHFLALIKKLLVIAKKDLTNFSNKP